jgi:2-desacetyl-2-hydroxyethyl bacteriochlorophyllide A dehydrogenase
MAIRLERPGVLVETEEPPAREPGAGEALVRVRRVGVCGTDFHAFRGSHPLVTYPRILGHELAVEVVALGAGVLALAPGDRCAVEPYLHCGKCLACREGRTNCCERLRVLGVHEDGGMRELLTLPADKLHVSKTLSFDQLALVETLGIGAHAVARANVCTRDSVVVVGGGPIGISALKFAIAAGARVAVVDTDPSRRSGALEAGACAALAPQSSPAETAAAIASALGGERASVVIDATGNAASMAAALHLARHGGRIAYVGLTREPIALDDAELHRRELTIVASRNSTAADLRSIVGLIESGKMDPAAMITHRAQASDATKRFTEWMSPETKCGKAVIAF